MNKLMFIINKADSQSCYKYSERIKDEITSKVKNIEFKGKTVITVENYIRFFFTSNNRCFLCIKPDFF